MRDCLFNVTCCFEIWQGIRQQYTQRKRHIAENYRKTHWSLNIYGIVQYCSIFMAFAMELR